MHSQLARIPVEHWRAPQTGSQRLDTGDRLGAPAALFGRHEGSGGSVTLAAKRRRVVAIVASTCRARYGGEHRQSQQGGGDDDLHGLHSLGASMRLTKPIAPPLPGIYAASSFDGVNPGNTCARRRSARSPDRRACVSRAIRQSRCGSWRRQNPRRRKRRPKRQPEESSSRGGCRARSW